MKRWLVAFVAVIALAVLVVLAPPLVGPPAANRPEPAPAAGPPADSAEKESGDVAPVPEPAPRVIRQKAEAAETARPSAERKPALPFRSGEQLGYRVRWSYFPAAATVELKVIEQRPFYSRRAWHFQAAARTLQPVLAIYELDDQFDSYSDVATLRSFQFEMHLREQGKEQERVVQLVRAGEAPRSNGAAVPVPDETRDALGLIYHLRTIDWRRTTELRLPVYDGRTLYEVHARREELAGGVEVPAGNYTATNISIRVFSEGKAVPATSFRLWLAADAARTPVLIEAELPFGLLLVELQHAAH